VVLSYTGQTHEGTDATYARIWVWRVLGLVLVLGGLLAPRGFNALELPVLVSV
jgi:hypothetical protein